MRLMVERLEDRCVPDATATFPTYTQGGIVFHDVQAVYDVSQGPLHFQAPDWVVPLIVPGMTEVNGPVSLDLNVLALERLHPVVGGIDYGARPTPQQAAVLGSIPEQPATVQPVVQPKRTTLPADVAGEIARIIGQDRQSQSP